jgi:type I restriction enzyme S subunit
MEDVLKHGKILKYSNYKDSGTEWLGVIPEHWECKRMKHIFRDFSEKNKADSELLSVTQDKGVVPRSWVENRMVMPSGNLESFKFIQKGDFAISLRSFEGGLEYCHHDGIISPAYTVLKSKRNIETTYFKYLFKSYSFISELQTSVVGIREGKNISYTELSYSFIPLPSIEEQTAIASFLDHKTAQIDRAINIKERQIELLKERRHILIHQAVSRGLDPNAKMKDSGVEWIGEIPEHWEVKRLKYLADITYGISPHEKTYNDYGDGTVLVNGPAEYSETEFGYTRSIKWTTAPVKFAKKGSLLFCLRGSTTGRLNICHQDLAVGRGCAAIMAKRNHQYVINAISAMKDRIIETFKGSTFPSVTSSDLDNYMLPVPNINEQSRITAHIENVSKKITTAIFCKVKEIEKLKEYKATLINSAVTGKIKVG